MYRLFQQKNWLQIMVASIVILALASFAPLSLGQSATAYAQAQEPLRLTPALGEPGTQVTVAGSGYPANAQINILVSNPGGQQVHQFAVTSDNQGDFSTQVTIPASAAYGSLWTISAAPQSAGAASLNAQFRVIAPPPSGPYTVQRGDSLSSIARYFGTSVSALLRANPQITNPGQISPGHQIYIPGSQVVLPSGQTAYFLKHGDYLSEIAARFGTTLQALLQANPQIPQPSRVFAGQRIILPNVPILPPTGAQASLQVSPASGLPGTQITVSGSGFPANATIFLSAGPNGQKPVLTDTTTSDAGGNFTVQMTIPSNAQTGNHWVVVAATASASSPFDIAASTQPGRTYSAQAGETLSAIAGRFNIPENILRRANPQVATPNQLAAGQVINLPEKVSFAQGATSKTVTGDLQANNTQYFYLRASAHQVMEVNVSPQDVFQLTVIGADGTLLKQTGDGPAFFRGELPSTQDYLLALTANRNATYTMNVSIPARISFAPGATQQTLSGRLPAQSHLSYVVRAQANQEMQVSIQPQGQLQLSIYGMDGSVLKSGMGESSSFQGTLPSTQDYILRLSTGDQAVSYQMTVSITGATTLPSTGRRVYTVQLGDTFSQIAHRFGVTVYALLQANPQITNPRLLYPGQQIVIP